MTDDINFKSLLFKHDSADFPLTAMSVLLSTKFTGLKFQQKKVESPELLITPLNVTLTGELTISRYLARVFGSLGLYGSTNLEAAQVDEWLDHLEKARRSGQYESFFTALNSHLTLRTYAVGHALTLADIAIWALLILNEKTGIDFNKQAHVKRWFDFCSQQPALRDAKDKLPKQATTEETAEGDDELSLGSKGSFKKIVLENAEMGQVKVRFPPEPSGYLHMGHFKAVLLNSYYKNFYKGKFLVRFDDTNPSNEKEEYVDAILEDLKALGVEYDELSRTSHHFDLILAKAVELIKNGDAYVDDTDQEKMSEQRNSCTESPNRSNSVEKNMQLWEEMVKCTELGKKCVLRAKISMKHKIAALRDPSLARCLDVPHPITGDKYKVYPLYDLACPIVDAIEGVTHALRDSQYHDREELYTWVLDKLKLRKVYLKEFSRINFEYTLLSKRKLDYIIKQGAVEGWDSPAVPTVRGILNRGMTPKALKAFIESQGASLSMTTMSMDKLWAINKKVIDPIVPRYTAVKDPTPFELDNFHEFSTEDPCTKHVSRIKNFPKDVKYSSKMLVEQADAQSFEVGEEITFMDLGNVLCKAINKNDSGRVVSLSGSFVPNGDFKKTKKKVTWLVGSDPNYLIQCSLVDYDHLITTKKLAKEGDWKSAIRSKIKYEEKAVGDPLMKSLQKRDKIQLERLGYYICNQPWSETTPLVLVYIPDGHQGAPSVLESELQKLRREEALKEQREQKEQPKDKKKKDKK